MSLEAQGLPRSGFFNRGRAKHDSAPLDASPERAASFTAEQSRPAMRSHRGVWGVIALFLSIPASLAAQAVVPGADAVVVHFGLASAFVLFALAVFDFDAPAWLTRAASGSMAALAAVFAIQGVSEAFPSSDGLHNFAFDVLGQGVERVLGDVFFVWCVAMLLVGSRGKTRVFGLVVMSAVVIAEVVSYGAALVGESAPEALKLLLLPPFVWLLLESKKRVESVGAPKLARSGD